MSTAFIGRFQPFHLGHKHVVEQHSDEDLVLVLGSAGESRTDENPLNVEERKSIIHECFPEIEVFAVEDYESDEKWLNEIIEKTGAEKVVSGNEVVLEIFREMSDLEVEEADMHEPEIYSGTEVRRRINSGGEWSYLVPECARDRIQELVETVKKSGTQYEFEPGWKKKNSFYGTADN